MNEAHSDLIFLGHRGTAISLKQCYGATEGFVDVVVNFLQPNIPTETRINAISCASLNPIKILGLGRRNSIANRSIPLTAGRS